MIEKIISEEPHQHWPFLNVKDKIVLDLGCGKFYSQISTAEYFVNQGAAMVTGVDLSDIGYTANNFIMKAGAIESTERLDFLLRLTTPEVIKCDIEGAEIYFDKIDDLPYTKQIAIEYHNEFLKELIERKFIDWGFTNNKCYQIFDESIDRIGVLYAWK